MTFSSNLTTTLNIVKNHWNSPPLSPDLNHIEHLWDLLERWIRLHTVTSKDMLKKVNDEKWNKISVEDATKLVQSMANLLSKVVKRKRYPNFVLNLNIIRIFIGKITWTLTFLPVLVSKSKMRILYSGKIM